jgi:hypothetical protein
MKLIAEDLRVAQRVRLLLNWCALAPKESNAYLVN